MPAAILSRKAGEATSRLPPDHFFTQPPPFGL